MHPFCTALEGDYSIQNGHLSSLEHQQYLEGHPWNYLLLLGDRQIILAWAVLCLSSGMTDMAGREW